MEKNPKIGLEAIERKSESTFLHEVVTDKKNIASVGLFAIKVVLLIVKRLKKSE